MSVSLDAGIGVLRVWRGEAERARGRAKRVYTEVAEAIEAGQPLDETIAAAAPFFPPLFVAMVRVGEHTGSLPETLRQLGRHYEHQVALARQFRSLIAWPLLQFVAALFVVGILIAIGGVLEGMKGEKIDFLGLGLVGSEGLTAYVGFVMGSTLVLGLAWLALIRRPDWSMAAVEQATRLPVIGNCLEKIALARIAWALRLTLNVEIDLRRAIPLVLIASGNRRYSRQTRSVLSTVESGLPLSDAFEKTGVFPRIFVDEVRISEESGRIVESMDRLSKVYQLEAESAAKKLAGVAAGIVWLSVASLVILLIFRVFSFYTGVLNEALEGL